MQYIRPNPSPYSSLTLISGIIATLGYCNLASSQTINTTGSAVFDTPFTLPPSGQSTFNFGNLQLQNAGGTLNIDGGTATSSGWIKLSGISSITVQNNGEFNVSKISLGYGTGTTQLNVNTGAQVTADTIHASDYGGSSEINVADSGTLLTIKSLAMPREPNQAGGILNITNGGAVHTSQSLSFGRGTINIKGQGSYLDAKGGISSSSYRDINITIENGGLLKTTSANFSRTSDTASTQILIKGQDSLFIATGTVSLEGAENFVSLSATDEAILKINNLNIKRRNSSSTPQALVSIENSASIETTRILNNGSDSSANLIYIDAGTLRAANNNTNFISGIDSISLGNNGVIIDTQSYNIGINTNFFNATPNSLTTFKKIGSGRLTLSGASQYTGATYIENGLLIAASNEAIGTGTVTIGGGNSAAQMQVNSGVSLTNTTIVENQGILYGLGKVGSTTLNSGGIINPGLTGNDVGIFSINGDLTLNTGSTYEAQLSTNGNYDSDLLKVYGNVILNGGTLHFSEITEDYVEGNFYTVIEALGAAGNGNGSITGSMTTTGITPFLDFRGKTVENKYLLGIFRNQVKFEEFAITPNQISTARALDTINTDGKIDNYVSIFSELAVSSIYDLLSSEIHSTLKSNLSNWGQSTSQSSIDQMRTSIAASTATCTDGTPNANKSSAQTPGACNNTQAFVGWAQVVGNWNQTNSDGNSAKSKSSTSGLLLGTNYGLGNTGWRIGGMFGYGKSTVKINSRHSSADLQNYTLGVNAGKRFEWGTTEHVNVIGGISYTHHSIKTDRLIPRINQTLKAKYNGNTVQVFSQMGYAMAPVGNWTLEPFAGLNVSRQKVDSFEEAGGYAGVHSQAESKTYSTAMLGVHAQSNLEVSGKPLQVRGTVGLKQALGNKEITRTMAFNQGSTDYLIWAVPRSSSTMVLGVQAQMALSPNATLEAGFNGEFGSKVREQAVQARVRWIF